MYVCMYIYLRLPTIGFTVQLVTCYIAMVNGCQRPIRFDDLLLKIHSYSDS